MKTIARPIEVIAYTDLKGKVNPIRFRIINDDVSVKVIKIDKVISQRLEKLAGNNMIVFSCQSIINNIEKRYEIKYELGTCKWILFKI